MLVCIKIIALQNVLQRCLLGLRAHVSCILFPLIVRLIGFKTLFLELLVITRCKLTLVFDILVPKRLSHSLLRMLVAQWVAVVAQDHVDAVRALQVLEVSEATIKHALFLRIERVPWLQLNRFIQRILFYIFLFVRLTGSTRFEFLRAFLIKCRLLGNECLSFQHPRGWWIIWPDSIRRIRIAYWFWSAFSYLDHFLFDLHPHLLCLLSNVLACIWRVCFSWDAFRLGRGHLDDRNRLLVLG